MTANAQRPAWLWGLAIANGALTTLVHLTLAEQWTATLVGAFQICAMLAHFSVLAVLVALAPRTALALRVPRPIVVSLAILLFGSLLLIVFINAKVYALYKFHLNTMVWHVLTQGAALQTLSFSARMWSAVVAIGAGAFAVQVILCHALLRRPIRPPLLRAWATAIAALGVATQLIHAYADATAQRPLLMAVRGVPWAQPLTAKSFLARAGFTVVRDPSGDLARQSMPGTFNYPLTPLACSGGNRPNILMIVVDSLRFDMLTPDVMPATSAWARDALRFERHYSTGNGTRFGIFGLLYGLPGGYWHAALAERRGPVLIDVLDDLGYRFFVYGSAPLDSPEFHRTVFTRVWDRVAPPGPGNVVERDRATTQALIDAIRERDRSRPFFGFLFLDAPHAYAHPPDLPSPFEPRLRSVDYLALSNDFDPTPFLNLYKTSVLFDDGLVGSILHAVETDAADDTIVLITGDHGQAFNETHDNTWGHNSDFSDWQARVPFVVRWPGRPPQAIDAPTSHIDWAPTLLTDALGCTTPIDQYSTGQSLFAADAKRVLPIEQWTQRALRTNERTYVFLSWGGIDVRDGDYRPTDEAIDAATLRIGFEQLSRFTRR